MKFNLMAFAKKLLPSFFKDLYVLKSRLYNVEIESSVKLYRPYHISNCRIGNYTYIANDSYVSYADIGKFCSIGPHFCAGWGIHPTDKISTSPMFYSTRRQNGTSLVKDDKLIERKKIVIGNDVFIGVNVTILDGVRIGDGAIIAAGAVVVSDVAPYSIVGGVPAREIKKRFPDEQIETLKTIKWWDFEDGRLRLVEQYFDDVEGFVKAIRD